MIATIQNRRGLRRDFDPEKMLPGEWAVSTDQETGNQVVWMCFQPGVVKRIGTYEDLEAQIEKLADDTKAAYEQTFNEMLAHVEEMETKAVQKAQEAADSAETASQAAQGAVQDAWEALAAARQAQEDSQAALQGAKDAKDYTTFAVAGVVDDVKSANDTAQAALTTAQAARKEAGSATTIATSTKADVDNMSEEVSHVQAVVDEVAEKNREIELSVSGKVDGAYEENGYLYLTSNDEVVVGPLGPFAGGSGGGGSTGNNAVLTVSNASGWLSKSIMYGASCGIKIVWSSIEDGLSTGNGVLKITVNGAVKSSLDITQGEVNVDLGNYLNLGANAVKVNVADVYGNNRTINFNVTTIAMSLESPFDPSTPFTGVIPFPYVPVGNTSKTTHFIVDGEEIGTATTSTSGRQQTYIIPAQSHGAHTLEVYFTATIDGEEVTSNRLYYEIICIEIGDNTPIIVSDFNETEVPQYSSMSIPYMVYDPASLTAAVTLSANGVVVNELTVDRSKQIWTYRANTEGELVLTIASGAAAKTITLHVAGAGTDIEAETNDLSLYLSSYGRSNNEENPGVWEYKEIQARFTGFNFVSDGWQMDSDNIAVLRVGGDARLYIPATIFSQDFRVTGKTIEIEFATRQVLDYDAVIFSCMSEGRGVQLTAQRALIKSEQSEISTQYKEDEHVRIAFAVEKRSENRLIYIYINGIISGAVQYPVDDDFQQAAPVGISIGSSDCTIDLYCIRVYDNDLTRFQILNNWIADTQDGEEMLRRYTHNNVFDEYGKIVIEKLPQDLPYLVLEAAELPQYKGDKKTVGGRYVDPKDEDKCFTFRGAQADVQGTSSQYYARKNYKIKFKGGFTLGNGTQSPVYKMQPDSIGTSTFTFKADVASSEGANNVELVRLYNDACPYKTPPQEENPAIRQGIDGFPIVIFWDNGTETTFIGKYNFNNDKGTEEVFGFAAGDESWEILNNTSDRVLWKSDDFSGTAWTNDFEARYPEDNMDAAKLSALSSWLVQTDQGAATRAPLPETAVYDGVSYTEDTAAYRLAKFKAEFPGHFEPNAIFFNYIFTELFLMVDNRAKNAFPSIFNGGRWLILPYDYDTAIGTNNEGSLVFSYELEDIDKTESGADVFNGQDSVLWVNLRQAFFDDIKTMYQNLRSTGALSYTDTEQRFEDHQGKWPEAVFNEDSYFKYLQPLIDDNTPAYLSMLQGSKEEQRKWWLYNRFRYIDSKYNAGDALTDVITVRGYAKADVTVRPYADIYASVKYGSYLVQKRALRGSSYTLECPLDNVNDTEIYIYSASQLASVGDLSGLMVGYAEFSHATNLQELKIGDGAESYSNSNLTELHLGNNILMKKLDVRNCPNLTQPVDVSGCVNIREIYMEGTGITGISLPNGGGLNVLHLPGSIANLTIRNQANIQDLSMPTYANITTLRLENVSSSVDSRGILESIPASSRVRIIGFSWAIEKAEDVYTLYDLLDTMRGLDENGNNLDKAQMSGTIAVGAIASGDIQELKGRYPDIAITPTEIGHYIYFWNDDGSTLLYKVAVYDGGSAVYGGEPPTKEPQEQYAYTFAGWSKTPGGSVDEDALDAVTAERNVYAVFTPYVRTFTVRFYEGDTVLEIVRNVPYGGNAVYSGTTPTKSGVDDPENYTFTGWQPAPEGIQADTDCYAQYSYEAPDNVITDSWDEIAAAVEDGTYAQKYALGDTKALNLGAEGIIRMQIVAFDTDDLADGSGKAATTWISEQLLNTSHRMNPSTAAKDEDGLYIEGTGGIGGWEKCEMRTYLNDTIAPLIPEDAYSHIKAVTKGQRAYSTAGSSIEQTTTDTVWIPSWPEVSTYSGVSAKYPFANNATWRKKKKDGETSNTQWATRHASGTDTFIAASTLGSSSSLNPTKDAGVALGFCI